MTLLEEGRLEIGLSFVMTSGSRRGFLRIGVGKVSFRFDGNTLDRSRWLVMFVIAGTSTLKRLLATSAGSGSRPQDLPFECLSSTHPYNVIHWWWFKFIKHSDFFARMRL